MLGDPAIRSGWDSGKKDKCCRDAAGDCRWFSSLSSCQAALAKPGCKPCQPHETGIGCPSWPTEDNADSADSAGSARRLSLSNNAVSVSFSTVTGQLISLINVQSSEDYLRPGATGIFLAWTDAPPPPVALSAGWAGGGMPDHRSGLPFGSQSESSQISPAECNLTSYTFRDLGHIGTELVLNMEHAASLLRFTVRVALEHGDSPALNMSLAVQSLPNSTAQNITLAFPYIDGLAIGANGSSNLGVNHFSTGITGAGLKAWAPSGGLYGWHTSQLWSQVWEPSSGLGFGMIVMDEAVLGITSRQRVITRFSSGNTTQGGMYALAYPASKLGPEATPVEPNAPAQLLVHGGGWRVGAQRYGQWLRSIGVGMRPEPEWFSAVQSKGSAWIPDSAEIAANRKSGRGFTNFTQLYETFFSSNAVDMIEIAMWWEGVAGNLSTNYGAFGADGIFLPREDCGGVAALQAGVERVHAMGRRIQLYVSADIVHLHSTFFNSSWPWVKWADWPQVSGPNDPKANYNATTLCHAFDAWQRSVAAFTARIVELTGVDGVRLDGLGGQFSPCYNPAHNHKNVFENQGTAANMLIAKLTREAMDVTEAGARAILTSEGYQDVFRLHTQGSLTMFYPGRDIDAMRVALPEYRGAAYSPDAGAIETALNGWMAAGLQALRLTWPYGSDCGKPPLSGFPGRECDSYPSGGGRLTRWTELRPTFLGAILPGNITLSDPFAPDDPEIVARLYSTPIHSLVIAARWNGSDLQSPTTLELPAGVVNADVQYVVEVDAYTLEWHTSTLLTRDERGQPRKLSLHSGFSAIYLPRPGAEAFLTVTPPIVPAISLSNETTIQLNFFGPWRKRLPTTVDLVAPGLKLSASRVDVPGRVTIAATSGSEPGYLMLTITGAGVLPTRRWIHVVAA